MTVQLEMQYEDFAAPRAQIHATRYETMHERTAQLTRD